jgi:hypothetical protein
MPQTATLPSTSSEAPGIHRVGATFILGGVLDGWVNRTYQGNFSIYGNFLQSIRAAQGRMCDRAHRAPNPIPEKLLQQ